MILRASLYAFVHVELVVQLLPHGCRVNEEFESNVTTAAAIIVSEWVYA